jgi:RNA polymerase sigma factor (sigma-70 family)
MTASISAERSREERFQAMVLPHLDSAFNLARWLTRSSQEAEDIVQEAYLRAFKFFDGFHGEDGRAWMLGIVRNTFYTWYQQNKAQARNTRFEDELHGVHLEDAADTHEHDPELQLIQKDNRRELQQALEALSVEFREVIVLRELEDLSYKQIAGIVGIPIGTVMSRLGRGRKQLAEILAATNRDA